MEQAMKRLSIVLFALCIAACSRTPADYDKQSDKYWQQAAAADEQLRITAEQQQKVEAQQKLADDQLRRSEELLRKNEAIAERWIAIQERYDRVLSAMEKQFKVHQP